MPNILSKTTGARRLFNLTTALWMLAALVCGSNSQAQCVTYSLSPKGDTLNCVDKKNQKQGVWVVHVEELRGEPGYEEEGHYLNDQKEGQWRMFTLQGDLTAVENYKWGAKDGAQQYYTHSGDLMREESWKSVNPENPYDTVPVYDLQDPGKYTMKVVKLEGGTVKNGTWKYYDPSTGSVAKIEKYVMGTLESGMQAIPQAKQNDKPKEVQEFEKKNSGKKKVKLRTGQTGG